VRSSDKFTQKSDSNSVPISYHKFGTFPRDSGEAPPGEAGTKKAKLSRKHEGTAKHEKKDSQKKFCVFVLSWLSFCFLPEKAQIP
jgi:hypothetical protein